MAATPPISAALALAGDTTITDDKVYTVIMNALADAVPASAQVTGSVANGAFHFEVYDGPKYTMMVGDVSSLTSMIEVNQRARAIAEHLDLRFS